MREDQPRILILRLSSIGDILLTTPFIRQVRIHFPEAKIDFVVKKQFFQLLKNNPHLNKIYQLDPEQGIKGLLTLRRKLVAAQYTYIFDLHHNFRTELLTAFVPADEKRTIHKDIRKRFLLVTFKKNIYSTILPIPQRYRQVAAELGVEDDGNGLEILWKNRVAERLWRRLKRLDLDHNYLVLAPGAGFKTKRWPIEYFREVVQYILENRKEKIILLGSAEERKDFEPLLLSKKVVNLAGQVSLLEAAVVLSDARLVVSNDSGLMHMATAVNSPLVAIFGSTVEEFGFFPYKAKAVVLQVEGLKCRPCSHIGKKACPKKHFKCMRDIQPQTVINHISKMIR